MTSSFAENIDAFLTPFIDYSEAAPEIGAFSLDDNAYGNNTSPLYGNSSGGPGISLQRAKSDILPSNIDAPLKTSFSMFGSLSSSASAPHTDDVPLGLESSSSNGSTSSIFSQSKTAGDVYEPFTSLTRSKQGPRAYQSNSTDSDSDLGEMNEATTSLSTTSHSQEPTSILQRCQTPITSPPCTPHASSRSLPGMMPFTTPLPMNLSPSQDSLQRLHQLQLNTTSGIQPGASDNKPRSDTWSESMTPFHPLMSLPSWTMPTAQQHSIDSHFTQAYASPFSMPDKSILASHALQQQQNTAYVDPTSTQASSASMPLYSRPSSVDATNSLWSPITPPTSSALLQSTQQMQLMSASQMKPLHSPPARRRGSTTRIPRKTQSTPQFQALDGDAHRTPSVPPSPNKARMVPKTVRRLASHRRMNGQITTPNEPMKTPVGGRLRMRGSMAALREANAMHSVAKSSSTQSMHQLHQQQQRKPLTLSFVNYGIEDAEELCSAVAPSGSYKVPLRGFKDSDDEAEPQGVATSSSPHPSPNEPVTPQNRHSPPSLAPEPMPLPAVSLASEQTKHRAS